MTDIVSSKRKLVLFDFDGTITHKDSLFDFIRFAVGPVKFIVGLLWQCPNLIAFRAGLLKNHTAKQRLISQFFKGWNELDFTQVADHYATTRIDRIVRSDALECLHQHLKNKDLVYVVSASGEAWIKAWCTQHGIQVLGTQLEVVGGKMTGLFSSPNCHGPEKVRRIKAQLDLNDYVQIVAYGDSAGDTEMLALADEVFMRKFSNKS